LGCYIEHPWGACALQLTPHPCAWNTFPCARCMCLVAPWSKRMVSSPGRRSANSGCRNVCFFALLGVCFYVNCLGTCEQISSRCKVFWGLLNLHSSSSQGPHNLRMSLLCRFAWFLHELHQKHLKIAMFMEEHNYKFKYRKCYKYPKIIGNCSYTPIFCW